MAGLVVLWRGGLLVWFVSFGEPFDSLTSVVRLIPQFLSDTWDLLHPLYLERASAEKDSSDNSAKIDTPKKGEPLK